MSGDVGLTQAERDIVLAALLDGYAALTVTVERIVAERVREAEQRGAVQALRDAAKTNESEFHIEVALGGSEYVRDWLRARAARLAGDQS